MSFSDIITLKIKNTNNYCIISEISKSEDINLIQNFNLTE